MWFLWLPNLNTNLLHEIYLNWNYFVLMYGFSVEGSGRKNANFRPGSSSNSILIICFIHKTEYQKCLLSEISPIQKIYEIFSLQVFLHNWNYRVKLDSTEIMIIINRMIYSSPTRNFSNSHKHTQYSVHITIRYRKSVKRSSIPCLLETAIYKMEHFQCLSKKMERGELKKAKSNLNNQLTTLRGEACVQ